MGKDEFSIIIDELKRCGPFHPGKVTEQYTVCNKPNCACKDPVNPKKHGPYYQLSYSVNGKSSTRFVQAKDLKKVQTYVEQYKRAKQLFNELSEAYVRKFKATSW